MAFTNHFDIKAVLDAGVRVIMNVLFPAAFIVQQLSTECNFRITDSRRANCAQSWVYNMTNSTQIL